MNWYNKCIFSGLSIPSLTYRDLIHKLRRLGFYIARVGGSHEIWKHNDGRTVPIPKSKRKDVPRSLLQQIVTREMNVPMPDFLAAQNIQAIKEASEKKYGWLAVRLDDRKAKKIINWGKKNIPDDIIFNKDGEHGRETDTHITIKYGLLTDDSSLVKSLFEKEKPIRVKLGKIGFFKADEEYDVIIIKIDSKDLESINKKVSQNIENEDTHPIYKPHCTIAYVKPGEAAKFAGEDIFQGEEVTCDKVIFIDTNDKETEIILSA